MVYVDGPLWQGVRVERWVVSMSAPECQFCASVPGYSAAAASVQIGGYFACPEVAGSAERDLRGYVWPLLPCPPARQADSAGWPGGVGQRPPGRQGSAVAPACLIPRGPAPPAPTYFVARNGERGPHPRGNVAGSLMRGRTSGYRPAGLRRKDPGCIAAGLSGSPPGRIAGGLPWTDRPVRSVERSSPYRTDRCACFPAIHLR